MLAKAQKKMLRSKQRLSKELVKVLEKVDIDRPMVLREKARALLNESLGSVSPRNGEESEYEQSPRFT